MLLQVQASDYITRTVCVWDVVGRGFRISQAVAEWHSTYHGLTARDAFEEILPEVEPVIKACEEGLISPEG